MTNFDEYQNLPDDDEEISRPFALVHGWLADGEPIKDREQA